MYVQASNSIQTILETVMEIWSVHCKLSHTCHSAASLQDTFTNVVYSHWVWVVFYINMNLSRMMIQLPVVIHDYQVNDIVVTRM